MVTSSRMRKRILNKLALLPVPTDPPEKCKIVGVRVRARTRLKSYGKQEKEKLMSLPLDPRASRLALAALAMLACATLWRSTANSATHTPRPSPTARVNEPLATTPPMGWNSWDSYGTTITEDDFKANAKWFAEHLKPFGWQYVVVDMEWFVTNPTPEGNNKNSKFTLDDHGRYVPAPLRFPSSANGSGFKPIADYVHSLGLKFGIHILRGIPKQAVEKNLPIEGSSYHAADAADTSDNCVWNPDNYGLDASKPAAQAYYDSIARLYASWDVDFIKVDCISSRPYKADEIRMLSTALRKTRRPIGLSLSPGAAPIEKLDEMRQYANAWRISDDVWDLWHSTVPYPQGLGDQFPRIAQWSGMAQPGGWPDADMLPLGYLGPAPGWGKARETRLTHDEQRTLVTLWSMFRSPLMIGANLTRSDAWTTSLLTNPEVIAVDQHSRDNRPAISTASTVTGDDRYIAVFNLQDYEQKVRYAWKDLGLPDAQYQLRDLWEHRDAGSVEGLSVTLGSHGCVLYRVSR
jgi:alpha-galactosidase